MFHDDGASTASTGTELEDRASIALGNGSRTSPLKEKPNIASTMRSADVVSSLSVKGMSKWWSCVVRRWGCLGDFFYGDPHGQGHTWKRSFLLCFG